MSIKLIDELFNKLKSIHLDKALNENKHRLFFEKPQVTSIKEDELFACYTSLKQNLNDRYGIIGGGIGLLSVTSNKTRLLFGRKLRKVLLDKDIDNTEIFDFPYPSFNSNKELINLSFFASREVDEPAEYVRILNEPNSLGSEIEKTEFLNKNHFLWIKSDEIINLLKKYDELLAHIIKNEKITNTETLVKNYTLSNDLPVSILIEQIEKSDGELKKELFASGDTYIKKIKEITIGNKITTEEAITQISNLYNQAPFPLLSYSLIYQLTTTLNPKYSHIVFPIWNTYSDINAYKYLSKNNVMKNEYSLVHGLYTIDENKLNDLDEDLLVEYKLVLRQMVEPIIDREHYEKIKARDIDIQIAHLKSSTIAVIMSRNLSHTDGSHVMVDFENSISKPVYELDSDLIGNEISKEKVEELNQYIKDSSEHFNEQFKLYNEHLRNTMELVADVSGKIGIQSNYEYCLKDFFIELEDKYFAQKAKPQFRKNLKRQSRFLGRGLNDGEGCSILDTTNIRYTIDDETYYKNNEDTIRALFPGGENGKTAFISILKNIFRNLKKHSGFKRDDTIIKDLPFYQLEVNIIEDEFNKNYYKLELKETTHSHPLEPTTDKDGKVIEGIKTIISRIRNHLLIDPIISAGGKVKNDGWGLLEMRICAAYLIGLPIEEYQYQEDETVFEDSQGRIFPMQFIDVNKFRGENEHYHLCHYLYLRKPKFATVWLQKKEYETIHNEKNETRLKELSNNGFTIKKIGEQKEYNSPSKFVLGDDETSENTEPHYNFRVLDKRISYDLISQDINEIKEAVSNEWIQANAYPTNELFYYDFNKDENKLAIKKWDDNLLIFGPSNEGPIKPNEEFSKFAILDNHFGYLKKLVDEYDGENTLEYVKTIFPYLENNSSKNESLKAFNGAKKYEVFECLNTSVTIFDERIQKHLLTTNAAVSDGRFTLKEVNELKGIYTADFSLKEFFYESDSTMENLIKHLKETFKRSKYIVLHFSGFEKVVERSNLTIDEANIKLHDLTKGNSNYIIFTSGKGIPKTLPKKCYFIPYTTLKVLIEKKPKFDLITALNSLRLIKL